jgi:hypothetical protein
MDISVQPLLPMIAADDLNFKRYALEIERPKICIDPIDGQPRIFFFVKRTGSAFEVTSVPFMCDKNLEIRLVELEKSSGFYDWALDPWTGRINLEFVQ